MFFEPERFTKVWGDDLKTGLAKRDPAWRRCRSPPVGCSPSARTSSATARPKVLDAARPQTALYWGGMGARDKNFYNDLARRYGYEAEAIEIQDLYLTGKKDEAGGRCPSASSRSAHLVGPEVATSRSASAPSRRPG